MAVAICFQIDADRQARLYAAGTYNLIAWEQDNACPLGSAYRSCGWKDSSKTEEPLRIERTVNQEYSLRLTETKRYRIRIIGRDIKPSELPYLPNESNPFLTCDRDADTLSFQFINYLGYTKLIFPVAGGTKVLPFEVVPDKIDYEDDYITMTESIGERCAGLLMDYAGSTAITYRQTEENRATLLEQFIFLRQFCYRDNIQGIFGSIKRNPSRLLVKEEEMRPLGYGVPSGNFYTNPFSHGRGWQRISRGNATCDYLPSEITVTHKRDSLDTEANRFIRYAIQTFDEICVGLIQRLDADGADKQTACRQEAAAIHELLETIEQDSFFDEVGALDKMPEDNQVLQNREGYSQIFYAYLMLDLALQLDWKGKDTVYHGESKNVALLYEYWLFFELFRIIRGIDGCRLLRANENPFMTTDPGHLVISLVEGRESCQSFEIPDRNVRVNLYYNRTFSRKDFQGTRYEGSYSRPFRPDYTLALFPAKYTKGRHNGEEEALQDGAVQYVHFDAKYRITDLTSIVGHKHETEDELNQELADDKADAIVNTYRRGDLLKMHTYNDAIRRTSGSYILYPGSGHYSGSSNAAFHLYDEILPGVGAFAIKPGILQQSETELRKFILQVIDYQNESGFRLNRMRYYEEMVYREPAIQKGRNQSGRKHKSPVSDTAAPAKAKRKKLCVIGYIRADKPEDYYFFLRDHGLLEPGREFLFYYYAIKGNFVYTHHKDIAKAKYFRFYRNAIDKTGTYDLESLIGTIRSHQLVSRETLEEMLEQEGQTDAGAHHADFYYVFRVHVLPKSVPFEQIKRSAVNSVNGNDSFSPHSPKVIFING